MSNSCELTGVGPQFGNNVSHSNRKTRRKFSANIQTSCFFSEATKQNHRFNIVARAIRSVERNGGIDKFLLEKTKDSSLSDKALKLKNFLKKHYSNTESAIEV